MLSSLNQTLHSGVLDVDQDRSQSSTPVTELSNRILDTSFEERGTGTALTVGGERAGGGIVPTADPVLLNGIRPSHKRRSSESETRDTKRQYSLERREDSPDRARERERHRTRDGRGSSSSSCRSKTPSAVAASLSCSAKANTIIGPIMLDSSEGGSDEGEAVSPETNLRCLVNFFRYASNPV